MSQLDTIALDSHSDVVWILHNRERLTSQFVQNVLSQHQQRQFDLVRTAIVLGTIVMLVPTLGNEVPISLLDELRCLNEDPAVWHSLALILLMSSQSEETLSWLQKVIADGEGQPISLHLLEFISEWMPGRLEEDALKIFQQRHGASVELTEILEAEAFRKGGRIFRPKIVIDFSNLLGDNKRLLVVHNIIDGQGDEMLRIYPLLQAFLDGFRGLEITLYTDRVFLYDHPRVTVRSIADSESFASEVEQPWQGLIDFFEPYLSTNTYNLTVQRLLEKRVGRHLPPLFIWVNKGRNKFTYRSIIIDGKEVTDVLELKDQRVVRNYDTTMRLIQSFNLPLRIGEQQPRGGLIQTATGRPDLEERWHNLKERLSSDGTTREIAVVNIFGGQCASKGFTTSSFSRLAEILESLVREGYGLLLITNGEKWGGADAVEELLAQVSADVRHKMLMVPIIENRQEHMRQIKYFVGWCDLVVTVEGFMMHLAYLMGKPYRMLDTPRSYRIVWHPFGRSMRQGRWWPPDRLRVREEIVVPRSNERPGAIKPIHNPDKSILQAAFVLWSKLADPKSGEALKHFMMSEDHDIRRWLVLALAEINPLHFRQFFVNALDDSNRKVRAAAANILISCDRDEIGEKANDWLNELRAFQYVRECRYYDAAALGAPALRALRACINGDEPEVARDAALVLETIK
ncbi:MAG TPA: hypothetical protein V6C81_21880 [Planktothrix sp.]